VVLVQYTPPPQTTKVRPLQQWSGLVGKCDNGHVLTPSHQQSCLGWAFCADCATEAGGNYYDIYFVPDPNWTPNIKNWDPEE
tara:strand:+ start:242 stop:487 length:246 start_codon:yes stop_codon:yes gene_type:complete